MFKSTECGPSKSDTIQSPRDTSTHRTAISTVAFAVFGDQFAVSRTFWPVPRQFFDLSNTSLLLGNVPRDGHDKCRLQLQTIKQQSSNSSQYRGECIHSFIQCWKSNFFFTSRRLSRVFFKWHRTRIPSYYRNSSNDTDCIAISQIISPN